MFIVHNFPPSSTVMTILERVFLKMFDFPRLKNAKPSVFSTLSFAAVFFLLIFAVNFISNLSLHSVAFRTKRNQEIFLTSVRFEITTRPPLLSIQVNNQECRGDDQSHLIPPLNVTEEERIAWFRKKLPEFEVFKSTRRTEEFDSRVKEFFSQDCKIRFFMTWISPVQSFGRREFLAMESLFKSHPHGCLIIVSRTMDSTCGYRIIEPLRDRGFRVLAVSPDLSFLFKNTPAEAWFAEMKTGNKDPGEIPLAQNLSNLLRLAVLYKYGGVYLDTDFIILKEFIGLKNSIGAQSMDVSGNWTRLNNAVLIFDKDHPLLYKFIEEFALTFDGNKWGHNGPYLVSRVVARVGRRSGYNFTVLPPMAFYPIDWTRIGGFFRQPGNEVDSKWVEAKLLQLKAETYGIHLWNRQSSSLRIEERSIIGRLILNHCIICEHIYSYRRIFI